jgi:xanthine dehydrogenase accessory factor
MLLLKELNKALEAGQIFVLATIVKTSGSSPRKAGAKMIIYSDGTIYGTIGGGKFEKCVIEDSLQMLSNNAGHLFKKYSFTQTGKDAIGMSCGGNAEVFMELTGNQENLVIFGGGHIGFELAELALKSNFKVTVVDDTQENLDKYNSRIKTVLAETDYSGNIPELPRNCFIVLVTRSHSCDKEILKQVITNGNRYIGVVGSKAKSVKLFKHLEDSGVKPELFEAIHIPIGLDIKAEGPFEIAVSIIAELIAVKNKDD